MTPAPELALAVVAAAMAVLTAYLIRWTSTAATRLSAAVAAFLLGMMAAMFGGAFLYFRAPGAASLIEGIWVAGAAMSAGLLLLFLLLLGAPLAPRAPGDAEPDRAWHPGRGFVALVVALVLADEILMGAAFTLGTGTSLGAPDRGVLAALVAAVDSPWFLFTMSAEMALTAVWLRGRISGSLLPVLLVQSLIMFLSPPALPIGVWGSSTIGLGAAAMVGLFVYLMEFAYRHKELNRSLGAYIVRLLGVYALMMAGLYLWLVYGSGILFAASIVLEMALYLGVVVRPEPFGTDERFSWQLDPRWAFELLLAVFGAELFMGALLDAQIGGTAFLNAVPNASIGGGGPSALGHAVSNGFWFVASVTGSTWFLVMMGAEMGALVVFKIRETRQTGLKVRLGLMLGAFALFTVYFPAAWSRLPALGGIPIQQVPLIGWTMGIGSQGPLAPAFFVAIGLSYLAIGVLSLLFGRRVLCSVLCSAPTMFQGTLIDSMGSFNRTGPIGRRYLSSRLSTTYSVTTGLVLASLGGASVVSYLDSIGRLAWTVAGADPTVFLFGLYFGVLWYVMFVTIPYTGSYNCVTMGWCHWGTFSQAFSRLGFFRLKVRDRQVCRACTTLDCAKACPVGLVDMPGQFRAKGEFRSSKCCGVGDCVAACPYGNMYMTDVRDWFHHRFGSERRPSDLTRLPVIPTRSPPANGPARAGPNAQAARR